jgi:nicotinate-nucleotide adenylyltransferase
MTDRKHFPGEAMALFGGTFDPVHFGHLRCADEARQKLGLNRLYLVPAGNPPHRDRPQATVKQRLDMLQLARGEFPQLEIDDRETRRNGPSYMFDTLTELRSGLGDSPLMLLTGQDAANQLHTWFQWERLFELAHIVILTRPGAPVRHPPELAEQVQPRVVSDVKELFESKAGAVFHLEVESIDISSSGIRDIIRSGGSPRSMLPAAVLEYINGNRLYSTF